MNQRIGRRRPTGKPTQMTRMPHMTWIVQPDKDDSDSGAVNPQQIKQARLRSQTAAKAGPLSRGGRGPNRPGQGASAQFCGCGLPGLTGIRHGALGAARACPAQGSPWADPARSGKTYLWGPSLLCCGGQAEPGRCGPAGSVRLCRLCSRQRRCSAVTWPHRPQPARIEAVPPQTRSRPISSASRQPHNLQVVRARQISSDLMRYHHLVDLEPCGGPTNRISSDLDKVRQISSDHVRSRKISSDLVRSRQISSASR